MGIKSSLTRVGATVFTSLALLGAGAVAASTPASADTGHRVSPGTYESRCSNSPYFLCLYYYGSRTTGSYWGMGTYDQFTIDNDLGNNYFFSGTGSGAGTRVRNNAAGMQCDYAVSLNCAAYVYPNGTGNWDYLWSGESGTLYLTWNDEASAAYI
ncbi:hypothetical protein [Micromonospora profundi]|uniref:hypothetical protein n=1 Tax=Micromonospora profundi TaxID=1420889 RepID=UPI0036460BE2